MGSASLMSEPYGDRLGPAKVIQLYEPEAGLRAVLVVDNTACGPAIGGVRMAADVSPQEVIRLARAMTLKNAAAGLPHGGGKSGIVADPKTADKPRLMRAFGRAIRDLLEYIPGPDMGTDEACMGYFFDETGRATGRPRVLGGIPLDEIGATGYGLAQCAEVAAPYCGLEIAGARIAIEGFGSVGRHAARYLEERGARLVAASDTGGAIYHPEGLSVDELVATKAKAGTVAACEHGQRLSSSQLFTVACDILVPAARPDSIHAQNAAVIQAKLVLEGANIPATPEAETVLHRRGILVVPDFIANAGGVICAAVEYRGGTEKTAFDEIAERIRRNTTEVLEASRRDGIEPRRVALDMALKCVLGAQAYRRLA